MHLHQSGRVETVSLTLGDEIFVATYAIDENTIRADLAGRLITTTYMGKDPRGFVKALLEARLAELHRSSN